MKQTDNDSGARAITLKAAALITLIVSIGSVIMITLIPPGSYGRIAMIISGVTGFMTSLTFFLQLRQKDSDNQNTMHQ
jgi:4-amino-4-deoxy-L-arabinose transferase-like glycosyltransferase